MDWSKSQQPMTFSGFYQTAPSSFLALTREFGSFFLFFFVVFFWFSSFPSASFSSVCYFLLLRSLFLSLLFSIQLLHFFLSFITVRPLLVSTKGGRCGCGLSDGRRWDSVSGSVEVAMPMGARGGDGRTGTRGCRGLGISLVAEARELRGVGLEM